MKKTNAGFAYKNRKRYYYRKIKVMCREYGFVLKPLKSLSLRFLKDMYLKQYLFSKALILSEYDCYL
jgi:hypothetical protein